MPPTATPAASAFSWEMTQEAFNTLLRTVAGIADKPTVIVTSLEPVTSVGR